jgi:threonine dehydrogenase-like Zn-dependent dehydrogenase
VKALVIHQPGEAAIETVSEPLVKGQELLLKIRMIGLCGSDLNSFRGKNPMVSLEAIGWYRCDDVSVHELRSMRIVPAKPSERLPVQRDSRRAA